MAATKTEPKLQDIARDLQRQAIRAQHELAECRARISEAQAQKELLLAAPLHSSDVQNELARHLAKQAGEAAQYLRGAIGEMIQKSGRFATLAPEDQASFSPIEKSWLVELVALLSGDPQEAAARMIDAAGPISVEGEGLPLTDRREVARQLDAKIDAAQQHEVALIDGLRAAGINVPAVAPVVSDPEPGEEREIDGVPSRWVSFSGYAGTYGWWPVAELDRRETETEGA